MLHATWTLHVLACCDRVSRVLSQILEIEYRKATAGTKVTCRICGKKFYPDKLRVHRKYFCGETAQRTEAQALTQKKRQRVVLPKSRGAAGNESESEAGDSSEDSIARQKRQNKERAQGGGKAGKNTKGAKAAKGKAKDTAEQDKKKEASGGKKAGKAKSSSAKSPAEAKATSSSSAKGAEKKGKKAAKTVQEVPLVDSEGSDEEAAAPVSVKKGKRADTTTGAKAKKRVAVKAEPVSDAEASGDEAPPTPASNVKGKGKSAAKKGAVVKAEPVSDPENYGEEDDAPVVPGRRRSGVKAEPGTAAKATPTATGSGSKKRAAAQMTATTQSSAASNRGNSRGKATTPHSDSYSDLAGEETAQGPPLKRRSSRALAQVPRSYFTESTIPADHAIDSADSSGKGRALSVDSGGGSQVADDASEYGQSGSASSSASQSASESDDELSDTPTEGSDTAPVKGGAAGAKSPAARGRSPASAPKGRGVSPSPRATKGSIAKSATVKSKPTAKRSPATKGAAKAGADSSSDASFSGSESSASSTSSGSDADTSDTSSGEEEGDWEAALAAEQVEKDIQEALAEAERIQKRSKQPPAQSILHKVTCVC
jgi:hypothetical protein